MIQHFVAWADRHAPLLAATDLLVLLCTAKLLEAFGVPSSPGAVRAFSCATLLFVGPPLGWVLIRAWRKSA